MLVIPVDAWHRAGYKHLCQPSEDTTLLERLSNTAAGSLTHVHKHHHIQVDRRNELRELNESISHFPACICVTKYVDVWYIKQGEQEPEGD